MRKLFMPTLLALGLFAVLDTATVSTTGSLATVAYAQQQGGGGGDRGPDFKGEVDVNVGSPATTERRETTTWYADPLWIALAVGAIVLIAVLFAAGSRGGGTTIVKN